MSLVDFPMEFMVRTYKEGVTKSIQVRTREGGLKRRFFCVHTLWMTPDWKIPAWERFTCYGKYLRFWPVSPYQEDNSAWAINRLCNMICMSIWHSNLGFARAIQNKKKKHNFNYMIRNKCGIFHLFTFSFVCCICHVSFYGKEMIRKISRKFLNMKT